MHCITCSSESGKKLRKLMATSSYLPGWLLAVLSLAWSLRPYWRPQPSLRTTSQRPRIAQACQCAVSS